MSRRQLRRLERELKAVSLKPEQGEEEQQVSAFEEPELFQSVKSPFLLLQSSVSDVPTEALSEDESEEDQIGSNQKPKNSKSFAPNNDVKKKRRNRKNKKKTVSQDWDENLTQKEPAQSQTKEQVIGTDLPKVFWVDASLLHSKHEIRKLFGSSIDDSSDKKQGRGRMAEMGVRSRLVRSNFSAKRKSLLISPGRDWLGTPEDIRLTLVEEDLSGCKWFRYDFEGIFVSTRNDFENIVEIGDPSLLVDFVSRHPYHVEALVRLSESYALMGEPERSVNLLERAIYILEGAWPANFKPFRGTCRLKFEQGSNYLLFVVLFRYSHALIRRGLYQTSLQVVKLLYNLDWEHDPMGALLYMDTVSILARDYIFVISSYENTHHLKLELLPNYKLNYALAKFLLGHDDANKKLLDAILTFPETVLMMLEAWKLEMSETFLYSLGSFSQRKNKLSASMVSMLDKISKVFISLAEPAWNSIQIRNWFLECVMTACSLIDQDTISVEQHEKNDFCLIDAQLFSQVSIADFAHDTSSLPANLIQQQHPIGIAEEETFTEEESYGSLWRILVENLLGNPSRGNANDASNMTHEDHNSGEQQD
ncbi:Transcription factor 25 [Galdieria sulphuraria]|uniref:Transcription factor 25 n=1 Tax=Galdieria sulphuraria TaxID=130081 RepID=M2WYN9_GALSU|nr:uncharacterized protein Gasu_33720 [Galdieria sulphuraria]EME29170.1 hypothetical protein Gasu_33720 [Galdieria sulphuraria]GJD11457.1 Transcription factor 25 [Galdieria sulphuraria]|eukprot:XP_005705690.1 hypothetical protein Gasu_33720 [Galdieria sulphuraria]